MKKLVLSLAMAACLASGAQASGTTNAFGGTNPGTDSCWHIDWSDRTAACGGSAQNFANALSKCTIASIPDCTKAGCGSFYAGTQTFMSTIGGTAVGGTAAGTSNATLIQNACPAASNPQAPAATADAGAIKQY